ncbi:MAG: class I SAM-dependent methyltransferase [bacterium]
MILVDDAIRDDTVDVGRKLPNVRVHCAREEPRGGNQVSPWARRGRHGMMEEETTRPRESLGVRLRAVLASLPLYIRLVAPGAARLMTPVIRRFSLRVAEAWEVGALGVCNMLFRAPFDPDQFLSIDAFARNQDTSDFFTLCRRVGVYDDWFKGHRILDVGCGPGSFTLAVAGKGAAWVAGIDIEPARIAYATGVARERGLDHVRFYDMSVYEMKFPDQTFDRVISHTVFEHLPDVQGALEAIHRVLRPGGEVVFTFDAFRSRYGAHVAHFVHVPWPCAFFSSNSVVRFWERQRAAFMHRRGLTEIPELLHLAGGLEGLNRLSVREVEAVLACVPFERVAVDPCCDERALLKLLPSLRRRQALYEYLRGSLVVRLRKPANT